MKKSTRYISLLLAVISLLSIFAIPASAANACTKNGYLCGWSDDKVGRTFYVTTGKGTLFGLFNPKIVLTQSKGLENRTAKSKESYAYFKIRVFDITKGKKTCTDKTYTWKATKDYTLKLEKNSEYQITVTPDNWAFQQHIDPLYVSWARPAVWETKKTSSVYTCG